MLNLYISSHIAITRYTLEILFGKINQATYPCLFKSYVEKLLVCLFRSSDKTKKNCNAGKDH